jgi:hypothetical protein
MSNRSQLPPGITKRGLPRSQAAEYCDLSPGTFDAQVDAGLLPKPLPFLGTRKVWDVKALDDALDRLSGRPAASFGNTAPTQSPEPSGEDPFLAALKHGRA